MTEIKSYRDLIALGSIAEMETQLTLATMCGYTTVETQRNMLDNLREIGLMLRSLQKSLKLRLESAP